jgi:hypothetical protein
MQSVRPPPPPTLTYTLTHPCGCQGGPPGGGGYSLVLHVGVVVLYHSTCKGACLCGHCGGELGS